MWTIYSIGDYQYLQSILNNVAALVGTGLPYKLAAIGLVCGVLVMGFQAITSGGRMIQFQNMLAGWILFGLLFGPGTTVVIQDVYSLNTVHVDNVPFGVAAVGSIMSTIGYEITDKLEQAFSLPKMTNDGFAGSLSLLLKARNLPLGAANRNITGNPNDPPAGDLEKTLTNYVKDCTVTGIYKHKNKDSEIITSATPWATMQYSSTLFGTRTYLPDPNIDPPEGTNRDCADATQVIDAYLNGPNFWEGWKMLDSELGTNPEANMQNALNALVGVGQDARTYMMTSLMRDAYEIGVQRHAMDSGGFAEATVISDARNKRNLQWAAESSLFMTVVRPMMTFFEGFFYALSPLYAFLVVLVPTGISMVGKYLLTAVWIQSWMPILAILNHYVNFIAQGKLADVAAKIPLTSMSGLEYTSGAMANWLATASMLAASTPAIGLTLVFGGAFTATHLAGRLAGGDHINENNLSPDTMKNGPTLDMKQGFNHDIQGGLRAFDAGKVLPTVSFGDDMLSSVQSSMTERDVAMQSFGQQFGQTVGSSSQFQERFSNGQSIRSSTGTSAGQTASYLNKMVDSIGDSAKLDSTQRETLSGILGGNMATGNATGLSAGIKQQFTEEKSTAIQKALNSMGSAESGYGMQAGFNKALAHDISNSKETFATQGMTKENKEALSQSAENALSKENAYQEASQRSRSFGMNSSVSGDVLANKLVTSGAAGALIDKAQALGLGTEMDRLAGRFGENLQGGEAKALGAAVVLVQAAQRGNADARETLLSGVSRAMGYGVDPTGGAAGDPAIANRGASGDAGMAGAVARNKAQGANLPGQVPIAGQVDQNVVGTKGHVSRAVTGAETVVAEQATANFGGVQQQATQSRDEMRAQIAQQMKSWAKDSTDNQSTAKSATEKVAGFIEAVTEGSGIGIAHMAAGVDSTIRAGGEAWNNYKAASSELIGKVRSGEVGAVDALKQAATNAGNFYKETGVGFDRGVQLSGQAYWEGQYEKGIQHGLNKEQAGLYADYRSDFVNRALGSVGMRDGGAGDLTVDGALARTLHGQDNGLGAYENVDPTIGRAIAFAAQTGNESYLEKVRAYNEAGSPDRGAGMGQRQMENLPGPGNAEGPFGGQAWYQAQGNKPAPRMLPDMQALLNQKVESPGIKTEGFLK